MRITDIFYRRPRLSVLALGLIIVAGLSALASLPRQEDPSLTSRFGSVKIAFPGASANRVESLVTEKVENTLTEVKEIKRLTSTSRTGLSIVGIELEESVTANDVEEVWAKVRSRLKDVEVELPATSGAPDFSSPSVASHTLLIALRWTLDDKPQMDILLRQAKDLEQKMAPLLGTDETEIYGAPEEQILVSADPAVLAAFDLSLADVSDAIAKADAKSPAGRVRSAQTDLTLEVEGALQSVDRVRRVPLRRADDGTLLRVGDVAEVRKGVREPASVMAQVDGEVGLVVGVKMQQGRRVDLWVENARRIFDSYAATLPEGITAEIIFDESVFTDRRMKVLVQNILLGGAVVVAILWVMMGWRSALLVGTAMPMTILAVLPILNLMDVRLQQISVTGLIIALGLLIDNAIVTIDEYSKRREHGMEPGDAIAGTVRHLFVPLLASTITTILAFLPIMLMPGATGEFVGSMGLAVVLSIAMSLLLSMTLIPALAGFMDRKVGKEQRDGLTLPRLTARYRYWLDLMLARPWTGIALGLVLPVAGFVGSGFLVEQFFPPADRSQFQIQISLPSEASIGKTRLAVVKARAVLHAHSEVKRSHWFLGENPPKVFYNTRTKSDGVASFAGAFVDTTSAEDTRRLLPVLQKELMAALPQAVVLAMPFEQGPPVNAPVEIRIFGPELDTLRQFGERLRIILAESKYVTYTRATIEGGRPMLSLKVDADEARLAGYQLGQLAERLNDGLEGVTGGSILEGTEELPVRVRLRDIERSHIDALATRTFRAGGDGATGVPLNALGRLRLLPQTNTITRRDGHRVNTVQAWVAPYQLPGATLADFRQRLASSDFELPPGYSMEFGGETEGREESKNSMIALIAPLVVGMTGTLVLAFNSFLMAAIIGVVAVLSAGLAFLALLVFGLPMGFMAIMGTLGLVGLAINDSIVVLSALRADARARNADPEAIREVIVAGTRHILSTTLTTVGGFMPLILFGGTLWLPLATAVAGGVVGATLLALVFVPCTFTYVARREIRRARRHAHLWPSGQGPVGELQI